MDQHTVGLIVVGTFVVGLVAGAFGSAFIGRILFSMVVRDYAHSQLEVADLRERLRMRAAEQQQACETAAAASA